MARGDFIREKRRSSLSPFEKTATSMIGMKLDVTNITYREMITEKRIDLATMNSPLIVKRF